MKDITIMSKKKIIYKFLGVTGLLIGFWACTPTITPKTENTDNVPESYKDSQDTTNSAKLNWREYFTDSHLIALIDTALKHNQELNITLQEIRIAQNEVRARKGQYLPFVGFEGGAGLDKVGEYTRDGAVEKNLDIRPGDDFPEPLGDYMFGLYANWEIDIWKKLRNAKKSAYMKYLASIDGKNFMVTNLIAEIANSYYELLALDNQLAIVKRNIEIQSNALEIVKLRKQSARVTELAVRRFEAQVLNTRSLQFGIQQQIVEAENRINFLVGRFPQHVEREEINFTDLVPNTILSGVPSQLLQNRPDIRQAEMNLEASKLDVKSAKANFYPSLNITAGIGYEAFNAKYLVTTPESLLYNLAGDLTAPLINRNALKATYYSANARQIQAVFDYERTILNAYIEVVNQLSNINNLQQTYDLKSQQVQALTESVTISNTLFQSARADYMEVLLTQRDALESKFELVDTKLKQMNAMIYIYKALGGGWDYQSVN